jgi:hypothetical protein
VSLGGELIRRSVERLEGSGIEVVLVEAPLHPSTADLYDTALRQDFLAFAESLVCELGATFVPLEAMAPFHAEDFADLNHFSIRGSRDGARKLSEGMVAGLRAAMRPRDGPDARPGCGHSPS